MRIILLSMLLGVSLVGFANAQEMTGEKAEQVKKEIMQIEHNKAGAINAGKGIAGITDWFEHVNDPDMIYFYQDHEGLHLITRDEKVAQFRTGELKVLSTHYSDYRVRVFGDGNAAILTYRADAKIEVKGKPYTDQTFNTEVYAKDNGVWRRIVHYNTFLPTLGR